MATIPSCLHESTDSPCFFPSLATSNSWTIRVHLHLQLMPFSSSIPLVRNEFYGPLSLSTHHHMDIHCCPSETTVKDNPQFSSPGRPRPPPPRLEDPETETQTFRGMGDDKRIFEHHSKSLRGYIHCPASRGHSRGGQETTTCY